MEWTVYNFECADATARERLVEWFDAEHPLEVPTGAETSAEPTSESLEDDGVHGALVSGDGETPADLAWVAEYVYVMTSDPVDELLADTADRWERAVVATFDAETETCLEAVLYRSDDGDPAKGASYEGVPERNGQALLYTFAMAHQFRFRAYAHEPPGPMLTPLFGAFDAVVGMGWGSNLMETFEHETGVAPTAQGLEFLESDPVLDEGEYYEADGEA